MFRLIIRVALYAGYVAVLLGLMTYLKDFISENVTFSFMTPSMCWFATKLKLFDLLSTYVAVFSGLYLKKVIFKYWSNS